LENPPKMELKPRQLEILEAAGAILNEEGIGGLTTKNIAKRVGFAESALYRHYDSKEKIIAALLQYLRVHMEERLPPIAEMAGVVPEERLRRLFGSHLSFLADHPHFIMAVFSDGLLKYSPAIQEGILKIMSVMRGAVMQIVQDGQKSGAFTDLVPTEELAHVLMDSFRLLTLRWRISDFGFDIKNAGQQHIEHLILLISKK
jgi:AcrR family transcriptional regulator